jgi:xanthine dehydrogenase YagR molybdenum-binding subunit
VTIVGKAIDRVDARLKVTGQATYAAEVAVANVAHAVIVGSPIARGTIRSIDVDTARKQPGVIAVLTHENVPSLPKHKADPKNPGDRKLQLMQDDSVSYHDEPIAVVVADTLEHAQHAAVLVTARFDVLAAVAKIESALGDAYAPKNLTHGAPSSRRGEPESAIATAPVKVQEVYTTPVENHNPMEPHATIAVWQGDAALTLYDATQGIFGVRRKIAKTFGLEPEMVRVIDHYVGGGFGCKGSPWSHVALAALAAKAVKRPVKLVVTRQQMFAFVGHRPKTIQSLALAAKPDGTLVAMTNDTTAETARFEDWVEGSVLPIRHLYKCDNVATTTKLVKLDTGTPTFMRAPGESTGQFSLESAMDELAYKLGMDPLALRIKNHADTNLDEHKPYSSKSLLACYAQGAKKFGWERRAKQPGTMTDGKLLVGLGMATATYPANQQPAHAIARLRKDGTVLVQAGTQDIGTGTYTIMTQIAADALGLPIERIKFELGDTALPETPVSGGSMTASSTGSAVKGACTALRDKLVDYATNASASPIYGLGPKTVKIDGGAVVSSDGSRRDSFVDIITRTGSDEITASHEAKPSAEREAHSCHAFGAHFCEVRVDLDLGRVRVARFVSAFAAGKILNPKTATSQFAGGVVWGIGMALTENTVRDPRSARVVTRDLADYHVPVNADVPPIDIVLVDEVDTIVNEVGCKGIGEIGICGAAAAVANAVYHATGKRIRDLPITLDKLL